LKSTQSMMERIHKQLGEFQEVSRGLSNAQQSLESVLGGVKTRGILGEVTLDACWKIPFPLRNMARNIALPAAKRWTR
jgi:DNA anti-recombination protein RmuC